MKTIIWPLLAVVILAGCTTTKTVEDRKKEKSAAYAELSPEFKAAVDRGEIAAGMPMDAVYIAWGKPTQVVANESSGGRFINWIYSGTAWQEYRYWVYRPAPSRYGYTPMPYMESDHVAYDYVRAEVIFENGKVREWRTMPRPPSR